MSYRPLVASEQPAIGTNQTNGGGCPLVSGPEAVQDSYYLGAAFERRMAT
jgi:hypothetical protein